MYVLNVLKNTSHDTVKYYGKCSIRINGSWCLRGLVDRISKHRLCVPIYIFCINGKTLSAELNNTCIVYYNIGEWKLYRW